MMGKMFEVEFDTNNAAFADGNKEFEVARILKLVAAKVEAGDLTGSIKDRYGNTVGTFTETEG
jgi:hypothetical protein